MTEIILTLIAKLVGIASQSDPPGTSWNFNAHFVRSSHNIQAPGRKKITTNNMILSIIIYEDKSNYLVPQKLHYLIYVKSKCCYNV
jgi:hypothetical protein